MFSAIANRYCWQDKNEKDKLATGLSYQQLNGSGVTTEKLGDQISIVFRI